MEQHGDTIIARYLYYSLLDQDIHHLVDEQLTALAEMLGRRPLILDCSRLDGLTSAIATQLITFKKKVATAAGQLVLCDVPPAVRVLLTRLHLDQVIPMYATEQEALDALRGPDDLDSPAP
jgi:anti-anti-sigma factor